MNFKSPLWVVASILLFLLPEMQIEKMWKTDSANLDAPIISYQEIVELKYDYDWQEHYVIVDVRSDEETAVSMIPGAITMAEFEETALEHENKEVIVYCTIGVRSAKYTNKLIEEGWQAWNYKGSILDWCEHEQSLETIQGDPTNRVHTYSWWYSVPAMYSAQSNRAG